MKYKINSLNTQIFILSNILLKKLNEKYNMTSDFEEIEDLLLDLKIERSLRERNVLTKARVFELLEKEMEKNHSNFDLNNIFRRVEMESKNSLEYNKNLQDNIIKSSKLNLKNKECYYDMDIYTLKDFEELNLLFNKIVVLVSPEFNLYSTKYDKILFEYANKARLYKCKKLMKFYYNVAKNLAEIRSHKYNEPEDLVKEIEFLENKIKDYDESIDSSREDLEKNDSNELLIKKNKLSDQIEKLTDLEDEIDELFLMAIPNNDENIYLN